jgi:hypothetical protein
MATDARIVKVARPTLYHPDLHKRNIFVSPEDPTNITAIVDWQSTSIEPAFWYVDDVPDFAQPVPDSSSEDQLEPKSEACAKVYNISTQFFLPKLAEPRLMDEAFFRPFRYCHRTWADGAAPFNEELIQTSRRWEELGFSGTCPFPYPGAEEIDAHAKDYKLFEVAQQLKHTLAGLLDTPTDGWVPIDEWKATKNTHKELYQSLLQDILANENLDDDEPLKTEAGLREIWPFDLEDDT